jgi:hypothetical protein
MAVFQNVVGLTPHPVCALLPEPALRRFASAFPKYVHYFVFLMLQLRAGGKREYLHATTACLQSLEPTNQPVFSFGGQIHTIDVNDVFLP